jgi:hypothetical protein
LLAVRPSRSDEAPLLDAPPLWQHPPSRSPFEPYHPGPTWAYEELTTAERAVVDHGRTRTQSGVHAGYNVAVQQLAARAASEASAIHLGLENLDTIGTQP